MRSPIWRNRLRSETAFRFRVLVAHAVTLSRSLSESNALDDIANVVTVSRSHFDRRNLFFFAVAIGDLNTK